MKLYKLTDKHDRTYNGTQWGKSVTHEVSGEGKLCGPGWLHAYTDPDLAVLLNPIHAQFSAPHLWLAAGEVGKDDRGLKVGTRKLTTIKRVRLPVWNTEMRVRFAICCAVQVYQAPEFVRWAQRWVRGEDRNGAAAEVARAAAWAAARVAAEAARAAAEAAWAATWAAAEAAAEVAAEVARAAAWAAAEAARVASWAAAVVGGGAAANPSTLLSTSLKAARSKRATLALIKALERGR